MQDFGPLAPFMEAPDVTEIIVEEAGATIVTRDGKKAVGALWPNGQALFQFVEGLVHEAGWNLPFEYEDVKDGAVIRQHETMVNCNVDGGLLFAVRPPTAPCRLHIWKNRRRWPTSDVDAMASDETSVEPVSVDVASATPRLKPGAC